MKTVMITGSTGFIGSHLAEKFVEENIRTHLYTRRNDPLIDSMEIKGAKIHTGGMYDLRALKNSLKGADAIIHCAGATKALNKSGYLETNVQFTKNILNAMEEGQRFIYISSQAAAGPSSGSIPKKEDDPSKPLTHYGVSKLLAEKSVREWGKLNRNNYVIIRPCVVYGPREKAVYQNFRFIKKGLLFLMGDGKLLLSIIHVKDLVKAIIAAAEHQSVGETYFACGDTSHSWEEIGYSIKRALNRKHLLRIRLPLWLVYPFVYFSDALSLVTRKPALIDSQKLIEVKQAEWLCSNEKIKERLDWKPEIQLEEGIKQTAEWYEKNGWF
ncbi:NAD-dependent epimerase/dehydratase family protein [Thermodesulfobacteriota bacterium]